jgi:SAM-dependent methyltransferase
VAGEPCLGVDASFPYPVMAERTNDASTSGAVSPEARTAGARRPGAPGAILAIVWDAMWAHAETCAVETAGATGLFDQLADGSRTAAEIARATRCSPRGVRMLADTLVALELLSKATECYELTDTTRHFLVSSSPASVAGLVRLGAAVRRPFEHLTEVVRTGEPAPASEGGGREVFAELVGALFPSSFAVSRRAREALPARVRSRVKRLLDVAAGSTAWSLAWAEADPEVRVTALDFAEVIEVTRRYTDGFGCTDRYELVEGDLRSARFGANRYDLVILGQICHGEGARGAAKLIEKSARALVPEGTLLVADMVPNDCRTGPARHLLFALNRLVGTTDGDVFTLAEFRGWMRGAGLASVRRLGLGDDSPDVIVGTKRVGARRRGA